VAVNCEISNIYNFLNALHFILSDPEPFPWISKKHPLLLTVEGRVVIFGGIDFWGRVIAVLVAYRVGL
jgi:hypothetical protein